MIALTTKGVGEEWADLPADLELRVCEPDPAAVDAALADDVEILVGETLPTEHARATGLRWVQLASAGTDQLIGHPLMRRDLLVSSAAGINAGLGAKKRKSASGVGPPACSFRPSWQRTGL